MRVYCVRHFASSLWVIATKAERLMPLAAVIIAVLWASEVMAMGEKVATDETAKQSTKTMDILGFTESIPSSLKEKIYNINKAEIEGAYELSGDKAIITAASVDLNGDGIEEVFARIQGRVICANAGCPLIIYRTNGDELEEIQSIATNEDVGVSINTTSDYRDIILNATRDAATQKLWKWNGSIYQ